MKMNKKQYKKYVEAHQKKSPILKNCIWAFFVGVVLGSVVCQDFTAFFLYSSCLATNTVALLELI